MVTSEKLNAMRRTLAACIYDHDERHFLDFPFANFADFSSEFVDLMCTLDELSPGAGSNFVKRIGSLCGKSKDKYEQIVQALCELVIAKTFMDSYPADKGYKLHWEPTENSKSNPEFMIEGPEWRILVEVKAPSLLDYDQKNRQAVRQITARLPGMRESMTKADGTEPALPLDNKVKDFLVSAEKKFSSFGEGDVPTYGLLFICWGERMFEAITPLSNEACGLLKERSYYKENGSVVRFPHISGVIVTQHQHFIQQMLNGLRFQHQDSCLHYGQYWGYGTPPNPIFSKNDFATKTLPHEFNEVLQTVNAEESIDPIAGIMETVTWLYRPRS